MDELSYVIRGSGKDHLANMNALQKIRPKRYDNHRTFFVHQEPLINREKSHENLIFERMKYRDLDYNHKSQK